MTHESPTDPNRTEEKTHDAPGEAGVIREATEGDAAEVERALLYPFYRAIEAVDPAMNELALGGPEDVDSRQWIEDDDNVLFVAEADRRLVGFVTAAVVEPPSLYARGSLANVDQLYVLPDYRRRGIASRLLDRVETWARDRDCEHVGITAHADNEAAKRLYDDRYGCTFHRYLDRLE